MRLVLQPAARRDVKDVLKGLTTGTAIGPASMLQQRFRAAFQETSELLLKFPRLGRPAPIDSLPAHARRELRQVAVNSFPTYLLFYTVEPDAILIQRVLHAARDPKLRTEEPF